MLLYYYVIILLLYYVLYYIKFMNYLFWNALLVST